jgi:DNA polymerase I-like protein with 3'-5' exonuclease and polymerase domains
MNGIALDTETTGANFLGGVDTPFVLYGMDLKGNKVKWEWEFDAVKRKAISNKAISKDIIEYTNEYDSLVFHHAKFDIRALEVMGVNLNWRGRTHDTMMQIHILDNIGTKKLKELGAIHLGRKNQEEKDVKSAVVKARSIARREFPEWKLGMKEKGGKEGNESLTAVDYWLLKHIAKHLKYPKTHPWWHLCDKYGFGDVQRTIELWHMFSHGIKEEGLTKVYTRERKLLCESLYDMEGEGAHVHTTKVKSSLSKYKKVRDNFERELLKISPANWKSQNELPELLFGKPKTIENEEGKQVLAVKVNGSIMLGSEVHHKATFVPLYDSSSRKESFGLDVIKLTKSGLAFSTDKDTVSQLRYKAKGKAKKYLDTLSEWKDVNKAIEQIETIKACLTPDSKVHAGYKQNGTKTTRMSAVNPNTQQISKGKEFENEDGEKDTLYKIREIFGPEKGRVWYAIDYSQLQLRIFAYIAQEKDFIKALEAGYDAHAFVATKIFDKDINQITAHERRIAKNVNFGFVFGASESRIDATAGIKGLWGTVQSLFPSAASFMRLTKREVNELGHVVTPYGYRLWLPYDKRGKRASHAGVNYKVQGCEGDIVRNAMIKVSKYLKSETFEKHSGYEIGDVKLIFQVHDELVFDFPKETRKDEHRKPLRIIKMLMEKAGKELGMITPVDIDVHTRNWDAKVKKHPYSISI